MKKAFIQKSRTPQPGLAAVRMDERGFTMALVAVAMVAIIGVAALSIDVVTLYLAKEEAQRSADQAALAAARVLSLSGITGDPSNKSGNWGPICGANGLATQAASAVVSQNTVAGQVANTIQINYLGGSLGAITSSTDCQTLNTTAFGVNPLVTVRIVRSSLPTFFSRIWGNRANSVSASATAEALNPSNSGAVGNQTSNVPITPVQPRCVKPWAVPNLDPFNPPGCTTNCGKFVNLSDGSIVNPGISIGGTGSNGRSEERRVGKE